MIITINVKLKIMIIKTDELNSIWSSNESNKKIRVKENKRINKKK